MTEAEARARIVIFLNPETEPKLTTGEIDLLVDISKKVDINGVLPTDTSWTPTYNTNYAIAQGWLIKAGRLADRYLFMDQGKMFSRQQFFDHCMLLHRKFLMRAGIQGLRLVRDDRLNNALVENNAVAPFYG
jgi:hypothetical protein